MKRTESDETIVVRTNSDETVVASHSAGSLLVYQTLLLQGGYHTVDFLKIFLKTSALIGELLHQLFERLKQYHQEPSETTQNTWLGFPILGVAALLSLIVKILNYRHAKKNNGKYLAAEDYLYSLFSCAYSYFILDLASNLINVDKIPLPIFVFINTASLAMVGALFFKFASPSSSDKIIIPWTDYFVPPHFAASTGQRLLNGAKSVKDTALSLAAFVRVVNREDNKKTVPMPVWQMEFALLILIAAVKIGVMLENHRKFFQGYIAFLKLLEDGALSYATISGIFFMVGVYQCDNGKFCLNNMSQLFLTHVAFFLSLVFGLLSAATTHVRFKEHYEGNEKIINTIYNFPDMIREKKTAASNLFSSFFYYVKNKVSGCCAQSDESNSLSNLNSHSLAYDDI